MPTPRHPPSDGHLGPPAHESLVDFMQRSPLFGADDVEFERDSSLTRETGFEATL